LKLLQYDEDEKIEKVGKQAIFHYNAWYRKRLAASLPFYDRLYYHTVYRAEKFLVSLRRKVFNS
jgi:hypothetical protein